MQHVARNLIILFFTGSFFLLAGCTDKPAEQAVITPGEGLMKMDGGNVWYKVSGTGDGIPLVLLHGGPGFSSFYLKPFEDLGRDRQVIRYDQLGAGKSDHTSDTSQFTVSYFVEELETLRKHLDIEKWHVLGHSWGSMLATKYYATYPERVESLTLGSPCLRIQDWAESTQKLLKNIPDTLQQAIKLAELDRNYDDSLYLVGMDQFYQKYLFGEQIVPEDLDSMMMTANPAIYEYMWGPSEFTITGTLQNFDITDQLPMIRVPVMLTSGEFDEILPEYVNKWAKQIPDSRVVIFEGSSHMTPWNAREESLKVQRQFLDEAEKSMDE